MEQQRITVITGHYGSGKTNIAVNMAMSLAQQGKKVLVIDLDIVNPYYRTADFKTLFAAHGIDLIAPVYANTNLDIPALPATINVAFDQTDLHVIIDVGGDDSGAVALGRYSAQIKREPYALYYVINNCRYLTQNSQEAIALLYDIETASRLKATAIINNSNLGAETSAQTIFDSVSFAQETAEQTGLPIAYTCVKTGLTGLEDFKGPLKPVQIYVNS